MTQIGIINKYATEEAFTALLGLMWEFAIDKGYGHWLTHDINSLRNMVRATPVIYFIATSGPNLIGFCSAQPKINTFSGKKMLVVEDLYVKPEYRRQGIALRLLRDVEYYARANDIGVYELTIYIWGRAAQRLYERNDMTAEGCTHFYKVIK